MLVEVCANSLTSALRAEKAGADRIELCSELGVGGITPSYGLIRLVKEKLSIPIHVLLRPRSGHFTYSKDELEVIKADIDICKELGVAGVVCGVLTKESGIDLERTQELIELAKPLHFTFHRAFDWLKNAEEGLLQLEEVGVDTLLTSGLHACAEDGLELLAEWQKKTKITIMAGGGIHPKNAAKFKNAGLSAIHLSGTSFENEVKLQGKIPMNSPKHITEDMVAITNETLIRQTIQAVK